MRGTLTTMERFYPIGTPGLPWTDADKALWAQQQAVQRSYRDEVLDKVDGLLEEAGSDKSRLLSAQIWVKDMADFDEMNEVRYRSSARARTHTHGPHGPVTSCDEDTLFFDWTRAGR